MRISERDAQKIGLMPPPQMKYKSQKLVVDGVRFDSKREAARYCQLQILQRAREISGLKLQVVYRLEVEGVLIAKYLADFVYNTKDGAIVVEDAKGYRTRVYRMKKRLMLALYKIRITEV